MLLHNHVPRADHQAWSALVWTLYKRWRWWEYLKCCLGDFIAVKCTTTMSILPPHGYFCYLHPCLLSQTVLFAPVPCWRGGPNGQFVWSLTSSSPSKDLGRTEMGHMCRELGLQVLCRNMEVLSGTEGVWLGVWVIGSGTWWPTVWWEGHNPSWAGCFRTGGMGNFWEVKSWYGDAMEICLTQERKGFPCNMRSFPSGRIPAVQAYLLGPPSPASHRETICSL